MSMVTLKSQPLSHDNNILKTRDESLSSDFSDSRKKSKDGEIAIFGAEKYFNGGIKEEKNQKLPRNSPKKIKKAPNVPPESSWGSQNALLQSFPPNPHHKKPKRRPGKSFLATIGCNCYCNDEKSVDTSSRVSEGDKEPVMEEKKEKNLSREGNLKEGHGDYNDVDDEMRRSLEVFGSPNSKQRKKSLSLEKRLAMLKWDANAKEEAEICDAMYEGEGSDASSDLFEIASFTNGGCVTPTTCYAPSEASVEWSVVTASAAEFSVYSDSEEQISSLTILKDREKVVVNASKGMERRRSGILSGCKSQKAVRVAGDAYRTNGEAVHDPRRYHMARTCAPTITKF